VEGCMKKIFTAMMALFFMTATSGLVLACGDGKKCDKDKKESKLIDKKSAKKKLAKKIKVENKKEQATNS
jgi:hypothetical protein